MEGARWHNPPMALSNYSSSNVRTSLIPSNISGAPCKGTTPNVQTTTQLVPMIIPTNPSRLHVQVFLMKHTCRFELITRAQFNSDKQKYRAMSCRLSRAKAGSENMRHELKSQKYQLKSDTIGLET